MLHRLAELDALVRQAYAEFDYKRIFAALNALHDRRSLGVLFRHPQGRALLRSDLLADPQGLPDRARPSVPLHGDLARADAVLHRRGGLVRRHKSAETLGASRTVPRGAGGLARRRARREVAQGAAGAPRRHRRARDRARRQAHRLLARGRSDRPRLRRRSCSRRWSTSTSPRSASPRRRRWSNDEGPADGVPPAGGAGRRGRPNLAEGRKCARSWKISSRSAAIRTIPTSRRATRRRCANGNACARRRQSE